METQVTIQKHYIKTVFYRDRTNEISIKIYILHRGILNYNVTSEKLHVIFYHSTCIQIISRIFYCNKVTRKLELLVALRCMQQCMMAV